MVKDRPAPLPTNYRGLEKLQQEFEEYQEQAFPDRPARFFSLELCGEAGEVANLEKKDWKGIEIPPARFAEEAADTAIALLNYANARKIDLAFEVRRKMSKIENLRLGQTQRRD